MKMSSLGLVAVFLAAGCTTKTDVELLGVQTSAQKSKNAMSPPEWPSETCPIPLKWGPWTVKPVGQEERAFYGYSDCQITCLS